ncbi:MAG: DMT family transporter [Alphaproteobacteria bacterium]
MNNISLYFLTVIIWGSTWFAITFQTGMVPPILSVGYRFILAAICLALFLILTKKKDAFKFTRRQHGLLLALGLLFFCLNYILIYYGSINLTSGLVAILFSTITLMNIFNQRLFFKTPVNKQVLMGSLIGLIGIITVFWPEVTTLQNTNGISDNIILCVAATYIASLGNMMSIKLSRENISIMGGNTLGMAYGGVSAILIGLALGFPLSVEPTMAYALSLLYLAVFGSAIAFGAYLKLLRNIGADKAAYAAVLFPIVALLISTIFEGYIWTFTALLGLVITVTGNVIAMINRQKIKPLPKTTI